MGIRGELQEPDQVNQVKMTEKWGQIQGKWDLVRVSGGVPVIRVRVTGVLL